MDYGCLLSLLRGWEKLNFQWHMEVTSVKPFPPHYVSLSWKRQFTNNHISIPNYKLNYPYSYPYHQGELKLGRHHFLFSLAILFLLLIPTSCKLLLFSLTP